MNKVEHHSGFTLFIYGLISKSKKPEIQASNPLNSACKLFEAYL